MKTRFYYYKKSNIFEIIKSSVSLDNFNMSSVTFTILLSILKNQIHINNYLMRLLDTHIGVAFLSKYSNYP